jgi:hypothetical protein
VMGCVRTVSYLNDMVPIGMVLYDRICIRNAGVM